MKSGAVSQKGILAFIGPPIRVTVRFSHVSCDTLPQLLDALSVTILSLTNNLIPSAIK